MDYISVNDISFSYDDKKVFEHFSARYPKGKCSVVMSPSGSGKTTLLLLIAGILKKDTGSIIYPVKKPRFSMVFQDLRLIEELDTVKNIKMVNGKLNDGELDECLEKLGIKEVKGKKVSCLSGGEKQRVAIARALLAEYDVLLLDEPFAGLDHETKNKVIEYLKEKTAGKTIIMVTHDKSEASKFIAT